MRVTEQIDALESLAIDSFKYPVVTRIVACLIALPVLTTRMNLAGLAGGFISETVSCFLGYNAKKGDATCRQCDSKIRQRCRSRGRDRRLRQRRPETNHLHWYAYRE